MSKMQLLLPICTIICTTNKDETHMHWRALPLLEIQYKYMVNVALLVYECFQRSTILCHPIPSVV